MGCLLIGNPNMPYVQYIKYVGYAAVLLFVAWTYKATYNFSAETTRLEVEKEYREEYDTKLEEALANANEEFQEALRIQQEGLEKVKELNSDLDQIQNENSQLQELLDEARNEKDSCTTTLSDGYYKLFKQLYKNNAS